GRCPHCERQRPLKPQDDRADDARGSRPGRQEEPRVSRAGRLILPARAAVLRLLTWCRGEGEFRAGDRLSTPWAPLKWSALWLSASTNHERPARPRGAAMSASVPGGTR